MRPELPGPLNYRRMRTFPNAVAQPSPSLQKEALKRMVRVNICYGKKPVAQMLCEAPKQLMPPKFSHKDVWWLPLYVSTYE